MFISKEYEAYSKQHRQENWSQNCRFSHGSGMWYRSFMGSERPEWRLKETKSKGSRGRVSGMRDSGRSLLCFEEEMDDVLSRVVEVGLFAGVSTLPSLGSR
jgi:hypothetical protein